MIANLIVGVLIVLSLAFVVAWALRPGLRAWLERPKFLFQDAVQGYDRANRRPESDSGDRQ
jgi:hypothetical protein